MPDKKQSIFKVLLGREIKLVLYYGQYLVMSIFGIRCTWKIM